MLKKFELVEIETLEIESYSGDVYDLEVGGEFGDHSYNIDNIIVHNSVCTTRVKTGVGYPQLSAIIECADAAHGLKGLVCADGGCVVPGDLAKAFGAGADFVMLGGMLAGHDECAGELIYEDDNPTPIGMSYYGMSSDTAMKKHMGGVAKYRASEGKTVTVPYKGPVDNTMQEILGGLRSACTYTGAQRLKDLPKCTTFIRVNQQSNEVWSKNS